MMTEQYTIKDSEALAPAMETRKQLIKAGFSPFIATRVDVDDNYQKCYADDKGKKYFITATRFRPMSHPCTGVMYYPNYFFLVQLYQKGTHQPTNLEFFDGWKVADVEEAVEKIWSTWLWEHYCLWEEE